MSLGIVVVSVAFGLAMGYGLGAFLDDVRPSLLALAVALAAGVTVLSASLGPDPEAVGGSLVLGAVAGLVRSEEHTSVLQSRENLVCRLLIVTIQDTSTDRHIVLV